MAILIRAEATPKSAAVSTRQTKGASSKSFARIMDQRNGTELTKMTPDREPDVGPVDVQDDSDRHDLEHAMDAHEARDDLPASSATLRSSLFRSYRFELASYQQNRFEDQAGKAGLADADGDQQQCDQRDQTREQR